MLKKTYLFCYLWAYYLGALQKCNLIICDILVIFNAKLLAGFPANSFSHAKIYIFTWQVNVQTLDRESDLVPALNIYLLQG